VSLALRGDGSHGVTFD